MKHAVIMTAYKDISLVNRIIREIPESWGVYVHIDKKSDIKISEIAEGAYVLKKYTINWGSINHLYAILELLKQAEKTARKDTYFHIITGQDYFVVHPSEFDKVLEPGKIYLNIISDPQWYNSGNDIWRYRTMASYIDLRKPFNRKLNRLYMGLQRAFNICKPLPGFPIYGGSVYCSLPYAAVQYILNCDLSPKILMSLKDSAIGEEIFFQTILMNSRFKDNIIHNNLRYSDWGVKNAPKILDESDFCKIIESTALFCRKVDQESSSKLLERLPLALEEDVELKK